MKAVVFIDVQKDFIDGALRNEKAIEVVPKIIEFAEKCVANKNCKIYATRDTHEATKNLEHTDHGELPLDGYLTTLEGKKLPVEHCLEGTAGWMIDSRLMDVFKIGERVSMVDYETQPEYACTFVNKPTFGSEDLKNIIAEDFDGKELDEIVLVGFCTDICVVSNALLLRAKFPNTKITVMKDLCAGVTPESHENALKTMQMCQIDVI